MRLLQYGSSSADLGFPEIDRILESTRIPSTDNSSTSTEQYLPTVPNNAALQLRQKSPCIIELTSIASGAGKTNILYLITSLNVLPQTSGTRHLRGLNRAVVVIDADDRFDVERLAHIMRSLIRSADQVTTATESKETPSLDQQPVDLGDEDELVLRTLKHVHVFRPQSLRSMVATVEGIESYLCDVSAHFSADRALGACILDGVSAFYWQHREEEEAERLRMVENAGLGTSEKSTQRLFAQLSRAIRQVQQRFDCAVVYTTQCVPNSKEQTSHPTRSFNQAPSRTGLKPLLPHQWSTFPTLRFFLERGNVTQFAPSMGAEEAWTERDMRWDVVKKGEFSARLLFSDGSFKRGFTFFIDADGVRVKNREQPLPAEPLS